MDVAPGMSFFSSETTTTGKQREKSDIYMKIVSPFQIFSFGSPLITAYPKLWDFFSSIKVA